MEDNKSYTSLVPVIVMGNHPKILEGYRRYREAGYEMTPKSYRGYVLYRMYNGLSFPDNPEEDSVIQLGTNWENYVNELMGDKFGKKDESSKLTLYYDDDTGKFITELDESIFVNVPKKYKEVYRKLLFEVKKDPTYIEYNQDIAKLLRDMYSENASEYNKTDKKDRYINSAVNNFFSGFKEISILSFLVPDSFLPKQFSLSDRDLFKNYMKMHNISPNIEYETDEIDKTIGTISLALGGTVGFLADNIFLTAATYGVSEILTLPRIAKYSSTLAKFGKYLGEAVEKNGKIVEAIEQLPKFGNLYKIERLATESSFKALTRTIPKSLSTAIERIGLEAKRSYLMHNFLFWGGRGAYEYFTEVPEEERTLPRFIYNTFLSNQLEFVSEMVLLERGKGGKFSIPGIINSIFVNTATEEITNIAQDIFTGSSTAFINLKKLMGDDKDGNLFQFTDAQIGALGVSTIFALIGHGIKGAANIGRLGKSGEYTVNTLTEQLIRTMSHRVIEANTSKLEDLIQVKDAVNGIGVDIDLFYNLEKYESKLSDEQKKAVQEVYEELKGDKTLDPLADRVLKGRALLISTIQDDIDRELITNHFSKVSPEELSNIILNASKLHLKQDAVDKIKNEHIELLVRAVKINDSLAERFLNTLLINVNSTGFNDKQDIEHAAREIGTEVMGIKDKDILDNLVYIANSFVDKISGIEATGDLEAIKNVSDDIKVIAKLSTISEFLKRNKDGNYDRLFARMKGRLTAALLGEDISEYTDTNRVITRRQIKKAIENFVRFSNDKDFEDAFRKQFKLTESEYSYIAKLFKNLYLNSNQYLSEKIKLNDIIPYVAGNKIPELVKKHYDSLKDTHKELFKANLSFTIKDSFKSVIDGIFKDNKIKVGDRNAYNRYVSSLVNDIQEYISIDPRITLEELKEYIVGKINDELNYDIDSDFTAEVKELLSYGLGIQKGLLAIEGKIKEVVEEKPKIVESKVKPEQAGASKIEVTDDAIAEALSKEFSEAKAKKGEGEEINLETYLMRRTSNFSITDFGPTNNAINYGKFGLTNGIVTYIEQKAKNLNDAQKRKLGEVIDKEAKEKAPLVKLEFENNHVKLGITDKGKAIVPNGNVAYTEADGVMEGMLVSTLTAFVNRKLIEYKLGTITFQEAKDSIVNAIKQVRKYFSDLVLNEEGKVDPEKLNKLNEKLKELINSIRSQVDSIRQTDNNITNEDIDEQILFLLENDLEVKYDENSGLLYIDVKPNIYLRRVTDSVAKELEKESYKLPIYNFKTVDKIIDRINIAQTFESLVKFLDHKVVVKSSFQRRTDKPSEGGQIVTEKIEGKDVKFEVIEREYGIVVREALFTGTYYFTEGVLGYFDESFNFKQTVNPQLVRYQKYPRILGPAEEMILLFKDYNPEHWLGNIFIYIDFVNNEVVEALKNNNDFNTVNGKEILKREIKQISDRYLEKKVFSEVVKNIDSYINAVLSDGSLKYPIETGDDVEDIGLGDANFTLKKMAVLKLSKYITEGKEKVEEFLDAVGPVLEENYYSKVVNYKDENEQPMEYKLRVALKAAALDMFKEIAKEVGVDIWKTHYAKEHFMDYVYSLYSMYKYSNTVPISDIVTSESDIEVLLIVVNTFNKLLKKSRSFTISANRILDEIANNYDEDKINKARDILKALWIPSLPIIDYDFFRDIKDDIGSPMESLRHLLRMQFLTNFSKVTAINQWLESVINPFLKGKGKQQIIALPLSFGSYTEYYTMHYINIAPEYDKILELIDKKDTDISQLVETSNYISSVAKYYEAIDSNAKLLIMELLNNIITTYTELVKDEKNEVNKNHYNVLLFIALQLRKGLISAEEHSNKIYEEIFGQSRGTSKEQPKETPKEEISKKEEVKETKKEEVKQEAKQETKQEIKQEVKKEEVKQEIKQEVKKEKVGTYSSDNILSKVKDSLEPEDRESFEYILQALNRLGYEVVATDNPNEPTRIIPNEKKFILNLNNFTNKFKEGNYYPIIHEFAHVLLTLAEKDKELTGHLNKLAAHFFDVLKLIEQYYEDRENEKVINKLEALLINPDDIVDFLAMLDKYEYVIKDNVLKHFKAYNEQDKIAKEGELTVVAQEFYAALVSNTYGELTFGFPLFYSLTVPLKALDDIPHYKVRGTLFYQIIMFFSSFFKKIYRLILDTFGGELPEQSLMRQVINLLNAIETSFNEKVIENEIRDSNKEVELKFPDDINYEIPDNLPSILDMDWSFLDPDQENIEYYYPNLTAFQTMQILGLYLKHFKYELKDLGYKDLTEVIKSIKFQEIYKAMRDDEDFKEFVMNTFIDESVKIIGSNPGVDVRRLVRLFFNMLYSLRVKNYAKVIVKRNSKGTANEHDIYKYVETRYQNTAFSRNVEGGKLNKYEQEIQFLRHFMDILRFFEISEEVVYPYFISEITKEMQNEYGVISEVRLPPEELKDHIEDIMMSMFSKDYLYIGNFADKNTIPLFKFKNSLVKYEFVKEALNKYLSLLRRGIANGYDAEYVKSLRKKVFNKEEYMTEHNLTSEYDLSQHLKKLYNEALGNQEAMDKYKEIYNAVVFTPKEFFDVVSITSAVTRAFVEEIVRFKKEGADVLDDDSVYLKKNLIDSNKRTAAIAQSIYSKIKEEDLIEELRFLFPLREKDNEPYTLSKFDTVEEGLKSDKSMFYVVDEEGYATVYFKTVVIDTSKLTNEGDKSRLDGATLITNEAKEVLQTVHGSPGNVPLKNHILSQGIYAKHAMFLLPKVETDPYYQFAKRNNIAILIADESEKNKQFPKNKYITQDELMDENINLEGRVIAVPHTDIHRIKEATITDIDVKGLLQTVNATGVNSGSHLFGIIPEEIYSMFMKLVDDKLEKMNDGKRLVEGFHEHLIRILTSRYEEKFGYRKRYLEKLIKIHFNGGINEFVKLSEDQFRDFLTQVRDINFIKDMYLGYMKDNMLETLKLGIEGTSAVISPDFSPERNKLTAVSIYTREVKGHTNPDIRSRIQEINELKEKMYDYLNNWDEKIRESYKENIPGMPEENESIKEYRKITQKLVNKLKELLPLIENDPVFKDISNRYFDSNYYLRDGYVIFSSQTAYNMNEGKIQDIISKKYGMYLVPTDSILSLSGVEVIDILPNELLDNSSFVGNSEYLQSIAGRDYDIDVMYFFKPMGERSKDGWIKFLDEVNKLKEKYIEASVNEIKDTLRNFNGYSDKMKEQIISHYVITKYLKMDLDKEKKEHSYYKNLSSILDKLYESTSEGGTLLDKILRQDTYIDIEQLKDLFKHDYKGKTAFLQLLNYIMGNIGGESTQDLESAVKMFSNYIYQKYEAQSGPIDLNRRLELIKLEFNNARKQIKEKEEETQKVLADIIRDLYKEGQDKLENTIKEIKDKGNAKLDEIETKQGVSNQTKNIMIFQDELLRRLYMQAILGTNLTARGENEKYLPLSKDWYESTALFHKDIGRVVTLREKVNLAIALATNQDIKDLGEDNFGKLFRDIRRNFIKAKGNNREYDTKKWVKANLMLLIATNDTVDFPKNFNKAYYFDTTLALRNGIVGKEVDLVKKVIDPNKAEQYVLDLKDSDINKGEWNVGNWVSEMFNIPRFTIMPSLKRDTFPLLNTKFGTTLFRANKLIESLNEKQMLRRALDNFPLARLITHLNWDLLTSITSELFTTYETEVEAASQGYNVLYEDVINADVSQANRIQYKYYRAVLNALNDLIADKDLKISEADFETFVSYLYNGYKRFRNGSKEEMKITVETKEIENITIPVSYTFTNDEKFSMPEAMFYYIQAATFIGKRIYAFLEKGNKPQELPLLYNIMLGLLESSLSNSYYNVFYGILNSISESEIEKAFYSYGINVADVLIKTLQYTTPLGYAVRLNTLHPTRNNILYAFVEGRSNRITLSQEYDKIFNGLFKLSVTQILRDQYIDAVEDSKKGSFGKNAYIVRTPKHNSLITKVASLKRLFIDILTGFQGIDLIPVPSATFEAKYRFLVGLLKNVNIIDYLKTKIDSSSYGLNLEIGKVNNKPSNQIKDISEILDSDELYLPIGEGVGTVDTLKADLLKRFRVTEDKEAASKEYYETIQRAGNKPEFDIIDQGARFVLMYVENEAYLILLRHFSKNTRSLETKIRKMGQSFVRYIDGYLAEQDGNFADLIFRKLRDDILDNVNYIKSFIYMGKEGLEVLKTRLNTKEYEEGLNEYEHFVQVIDILPLEDYKAIKSAFNNHPTIGRLLSSFGGEIILQATINNSLYSEKNNEIITKAYKVGSTYSSILESVEAVEHTLKYDIESIIKEYERLYDEGFRIIPQDKLLDVMLLTLVGYPTSNVIKTSGLRNRRTEEDYMFDEYADTKASIGTATSTRKNPENQGLLYYTAINNLDYFIESYTKYLRGYNIVTGINYFLESETPDEQKKRLRERTFEYPKVKTDVKSSYSNYSFNEFVNKLRNAQELSDIIELENIHMETYKNRIMSSVGYLPIDVIKSQEEYLKNKYQQLKATRSDKIKGELAYNFLKLLQEPKAKVPGKWMESTLTVAENYSNRIFPHNYELPGDLAATFSTITEKNEITMEQVGIYASHFMNDITLENMYYSLTDVMRTKLQRLEDSLGVFYDQSVRILNKAFNTYQNIKDPAVKLKYYRLIDKGLGVLASIPGLRVKPEFKMGNLSISIEIRGLEEVSYGTTIKLSSTKESYTVLLSTENVLKAFDKIVEVIDKVLNVLSNRESKGTKLIDAMNLRSFSETEKDNLIKQLKETKETLFGLKEDAEKLSKEDPKITFENYFIELLHAKASLYNAFKLIVDTIKFLMEFKEKSEENKYYEHTVNAMLSKYLQYRKILLLGRQHKPFITSKFSAPLSVIPKVYDRTKLITLLSIDKVLKSKTTSVETRAQIYRKENNFWDTVIPSSIDTPTDLVTYGINSDLSAAEISLPFPDTLIALITQLRETVNRDMFRLYMMVYDRYSHLENPYAYETVKRELIRASGSENRTKDMHDREQLKTKFELNKANNRNTYISFYVSGMDSDLEIRGKLVEITDDKIKIETDEGRLAYSFSNIFTYDFDGNSVIGNVRVYEKLLEEDEQKFGNLPIFKKLLIVFQVLIAGIRAFTAQIKSRLSQVIGTHVSIAENDIAWLKYSLGGGRRRAKVGNVIQQAGVISNLAESISVVAQRLLVDVYAEQAVSVGPHGIIDFSSSALAEGKGILWRLRRDLKAFREVMKIKKLRSESEIIKEIEDLENRIKDLAIKGAKEAADLIIAKNKIVEILKEMEMLRYEADERKVRLMKLERELKETAYEKLSPMAKEKLDRILQLLRKDENYEVNLLFNFSRKTFELLRSKLVYDFLVTNRLEYINSVEGNIRNVSFGTRLIVYLDRYPYQLSKAIEHAKRGVIIDHALYSALHQTFAANSSYLGKIVSLLKQFYFNRIIETVYRYKEAKNIIKAFGVDYIIKDMKRKETFVQNPVRWLVNFFTVNYLLYSLGKFVMGLEWFMNPILLSIFSIIEYIGILGSDDDERKEDEAKYIIIKALQLGGAGFGITYFVTSAYNLIESNKLERRGYIEDRWWRQETMNRIIAILPISILKDTRKLIDLFHSFDDPRVWQMASYEEIYNTAFDVLTPFGLYYQYDDLGITTYEKILHAFTWWYPYSLKEKGMERIIRGKIERRLRNADDIYKRKINTFVRRLERMSR